MVFCKAPNTNAKSKNRSTSRDFANQTWHLSRWNGKQIFLARTSSSRRARSSFFPRSCFPTRRSPVLRRLRSFAADLQSSPSPPKNVIGGPRAARCRRCLFVVLPVLGAHDAADNFVKQDCCADCQGSSWKGRRE